MKLMLQESFSRIIEMAWKDRTPFEAIESQFNLSEQTVINTVQELLLL
jgi:uncharacterized protein (TIGR03643 family)